LGRIPFGDSGDGTQKPALGDFEETAEYRDMDAGKEKPCPD
jgi:hypothetical protein